MIDDEEHDEHDRRPDGFCVIVVTFVVESGV
jgi:hypothetical protein